MEFTFRYPDVVSFGLVSNSLALACNLPHFRAIPPPIQTSKSDVNRVTVHYSGDIRISQRPIRIIEITKGSIRVENTVLRADKIFYYPDGGTDSDGVSHLPLSGSAYGSVSLTNPLGGMTADNLNFDLNEKSGDAKNANIRLPGIQAQSGECWGFPLKAT